MTFALTLLVVLHPGSDAMAASLANAARQTLGAQAKLEVRLAAEPFDDAATLELARASGARAVASIGPVDGNPQRFRVRLHDRVTGRWVARDVDFAPDDAAQERGRTLGFTLASMLPDAAAAAGDAEPEPLVGAAGSPGADDDANAAAREEVAHAPEPPERSGDEPRAVVASAAATVDAKPADWTFSIDAALQGVAAIEGEGSALGAEIGGQYRLGDRLSLRAGAALRVGHVEALEATMLTVDLGPGVVWRSADPEPERPWALALRIDAFARLQSLARTAVGMRPAEHDSRFVPGIGLVVETRYALTRQVAITAAAGGQVLLGETDVLLGDTQVASFAPVDLMLALGTQARF